MKPTTGARVNLPLIKFCAQLQHLIRSAAFRPTKYWSDSVSLIVDAQQAVPETRSGNVVDARDQHRQSHQGMIQRVANERQQLIGVSVESSTQLNEDTAGRSVD